MRNNSIFVYPKSLEKKPDAGAVANSSMSYAHLRRPINPALLKVRRSTIDQARSIPSDIRPRALVVNYPCIANILTAAWPDLIRFDKTLNEFMVDNRGTARAYYWRSCSTCELARLFRQEAQASDKNRYLKYRH